MLDGTLVVRETETVFDQREIEACSLGLDGARAFGHRVTITPAIAGRNCPRRKAKDPEGAGTRMCAAAAAGGGALGRAGRPAPALLTSGSAARRRPRSPCRHLASAHPPDRQPGCTLQHHPRAVSCRRP